MSSRMHDKRTGEGASPDACGAFRHHLGAPFAITVVRGGFSRYREAAYLCRTERTARAVNSGGIAEVKTPSRLIGAEFIDFRRE